MAITLVASTRTNWLGQSTNIKGCPDTLNVIAGDILVSMASIYGGNLTGMSGGTDSWTMRVADASASTAFIYTSTITSTQSFNPSVAKSTIGNVEFGACVMQFRGASGVGVSTSQIGAGLPEMDTPLLTGSNSAIVLFDVDDVGNPDDAIWLTGAGSFTSVLENAGESIATGHGGFHPNAGPASIYHVGQTWPDGQGYILLALELTQAGGGGSSGATTAWFRA